MMRRARRRDRDQRIAGCSFHRREHGLIATLEFDGDAVVGYAARQRGHIRATRPDEFGDRQVSTSASRWPHNNTVFRLFQPRSVLFTSAYTERIKA
jgi:hypothetical protein